MRRTSAESLLFVLFVVTLAVGCGTSASTTPASSPRSRALFANMLQGRLPGGARAAPPRAEALAFPPPASSAELVERDLRARGIEVPARGADAATLFAALRERHGVAPIGAVRPGDVVVFDLGDKGCGEHVALVEAVERDGRISFREVRGGRARTSFAHPGAPSRRRDETGRLLNSYLRPKRREDPIATRYFAAELLCAVVQVEAPPVDTLQAFR